MKAPPPTEPAPPADTVTAVKALGDYRRAQKDYLRWVKAGTVPDLITELPFYVREMVEALAAAAVTHPELLAEVARDWVAWPVMAARHFSQGPDFAALANRIELGADAVVSVSPCARYRWDTPLNRSLLSIIQHHYLQTPKQFYFLTPPEHQPRLTRRSLRWYLDEFLMPLLDELREEQGNWDGVPPVAELVKGIGEAKAQRRVARKHIRAALVEMAGPEAAERRQEAEGIKVEGLKVQGRRSRAQRKMAGSETETEQIKPNAEPT